MALRNFGNSAAITRRRRPIATACAYGLSLTIRFTSAAGDEAESMAPATAANPMTSVMIAHGARISDKDWALGLARPIAFHLGAPPGPRSRCTARKSPMPMPFMPNCASHT
jgi:hypothetical protein